MDNKWKIFFLMSGFRQEDNTFLVCSTQERMRFYQEATFLHFMGVHLQETLENRFGLMKELSCKR